VSPHSLIGALGIYAGTFAVAMVSSLVPFVLIDAFVVGIIAAAGSAVAVPIVVVAAAGQLAGKLPIYYATRGVTALSQSRQARLERIRRWLARWHHRPHVVLALGAVFGIPPFSLVATTAGVLAIDVRAFSAIVFGGRLVRFAVLGAVSVWQLA
jgi:membrane protein YqaA with SNARE-associated domain